MIAGLLEANEIQDASFIAPDAGAGSNLVLEKVSYFYWTDCGTDGGVEEGGTTEIAAAAAVGRGTNGSGVYAEHGDRCECDVIMTS